MSVSSVHATCAEAFGVAYTGLCRSSNCATDLPCHKVVHPITPSDLGQKPRRSRRSLASQSTGKRQMPRHRENLGEVFSRKKRFITGSSKGKGGFLGWVGRFGASDQTVARQGPRCVCTATSGCCLHPNPDAPCMEYADQLGWFGGSM